MTEAGDLRSDAEIIQQLGAAVLLCWHELSFMSQGQILAQAHDMIGVMPMPNARDRIVGLLLRRAPRTWEHDNSQDVLARYEMLDNEIAAFRKNAEDCQNRSHQAADRATKAEWLDLTTQWHWLATQAAELNGIPPVEIVTRD